MSPVFSIWKRSKLLEVILLTIFIIALVTFIGTRGNSGADYLAYLDMFSLVPSLDNFSLDTTSQIHGEFGYLFLNSIIKTAGFEIVLLFIVIAILSIFSKFWFVFKTSSYPLLAISLYLSHYFILIEFVQVRWGAAIGLLCVCLYFFNENKKLKSLLFFFAAVSIHYFSFIFVFIYFLNCRWFTISRLNFLFLTSTIVGFLINVPGIFISFIHSFLSQVPTLSYVSGKLVGYAVNNSTELSIIVKVKVLLFYGLFYLFYLFSHRSTSKSKLYAKAYIFSLSLVMVFSSFSVLSARLLVFSELIVFVLISDSIRRVKPEWVRILMTLGLILFSFFYFRFIIFGSYQSGILWDYNTVLSVYL